MNQSELPEGLRKTPMSVPTKRSFSSAGLIASERTGMSGRFEERFVQVWPALVVEKTWREAPTNPPKVT